MFQFPVSLIVSGCLSSAAEGAYKAEVYIFATLYTFPVHIYNPEPFTLNPERLTYGTALHLHRKSV